MILVVFFVSLYLLTMGGHLDSPDEEQMFQVTRSLVERGSLAVGETATPQQFLQTGSDGQAYAHYGLVSSILSMPFYALGRGAAALMPPRFGEVVERFAVGLRDPLLTAAACLLVYLLAVELQYTGAVAIAVTLAYGATTFAWPLAKYSWTEPVTSFWLLLSVYGAMRAIRGAPVTWSLVSSLALGLAVGSKITTAIAAPALFAYLLAAGPGPLRRRLERAVPFGLILLIPALGLALVNTLRFGNPFVTGYYPEVYYWHPIGVAGLLLSPSKSLFLYAPVALLGLAGFIVLAARRPWASGLFLYLIVSHVLIYGLFVLWWHGDAAWGPRYLLPVLAFIILPAGAALDWTHGWLRRGYCGAFAVLASLGAVVNLGGVLVDQRVSFTYLLGLADFNPYRMDDMRWDPGLSPVLVHWADFAERASLVANYWSQPVSLMAGTYAKEPVESVDAPDAARSDLFPRWTSASAVFHLKDPSRNTQLVFEYLDNRPASMKPAEVRVSVDGSPLQEGDMSRVHSSTPIPDGRLPWFIRAQLDGALAGKTDATVEIRATTWQPARDAPPSNDVRDLGIQIWDLNFVSDGHELSIKEAPFSAMPVTDAQPWSYAAETWFYTPPHLVDMWFWYLALSDLPRGLLALVILPIAGLVWSIVWLRRLLF